MTPCADRARTKKDLARWPTWKWERVGYELYGLRLFDPDQPTRMQEIVIEAEVERRLET